MVRSISYGIAVYFLVQPCFFYAQVDMGDDLGNHLGEILGEAEEQTEEYLAEWYEDFSELASLRQNINQVPRETIEKLPFLTAYQIHSFLEYRENYGTIYSQNELWLIPGFHEEIIHKFLMLFDCGYSTEIYSPSSGIKRKPKQTLLLRSKVENPLRQGFITSSDSLQSFRGPPVYRLVKYELEKKDRIRIGFTLENDAGEAFALDSLKTGFDFLSGYIEWKAKKATDKFILGDYKITSSEGLIFSSGRNSKSSIQSFRRSMPELKKYSSTAEYGFLRGAAIQLSRGNFRLLSFYSRTRESANIYTSSDSTEYFQSVNTSGLHRNSDENALTDNIRLGGAGIILARTTEKLQLGYNAKYITFSPSMAWFSLGDRWSEQVISRDLFCQSIFYNIQEGKFFLSGELAAGKSMAMAFQQKASFFLHPLFTLNLGYRNFSAAYFCPGANTFAESGDPQNEKGFYTGFSAYPFPLLKMSGYIDFYSFPRIDTRSTFPLSGNDFLLDTEWFLFRGLDLRIFFKTENKEAKVSTTGTSISSMEYQRTTRFYSQLGMQITDALYSRTRLEIKKLSGESVKASSGILLYQELSQSLFREKMKFNLRYTLFDISDWNVRIYAWEHDLLYSFYSPAWYKTGYNAFFNFRWKTTEWSNMGLKFSITGYTSPRESGTGADYRKSGRYFEGKVQVILKLSGLGWKGPSAPL